MSYSLIKVEPVGMYVHVCEGGGGARLEAKS